MQPPVSRSASRPSPGIKIHANTGKRELPHVHAHEGAHACHKTWGENICSPNTACIRTQTQANGYGSCAHLLHPTCISTNTPSFHTGPHDGRNNTGIKHMHHEYAFRQHNCATQTGGMSLQPQSQECNVLQQQVSPTLHTPDPGSH